MEAQQLSIDRFKAETDAEVKTYEAETRRLQAMAAGMQPEQVQEVVMQTLRDIMAVGEAMGADRLAEPQQELPQ